EFRVSAPDTARTINYLIRTRGFKAVDAILIALSSSDVSVTGINVRYLKVSKGRITFGTITFYHSTDVNATSACCVEANCIASLIHFKAPNWISTKLNLKAGASKT